MATNKRDLKAYSRFDGTGRIVPGSTVLRRNKPKNGNWKEVQAYECCNEDCTPVSIPTTCTFFSEFPTPDGFFLKFIVDETNCTGFTTLTPFQFQKLISSPVSDAQDVVDLINADVDFQANGITAVVDGDCISISLSKCKCLYITYGNNISANVMLNVPA